MISAIQPVNVPQVTLGISTLLYFVPTELAASHQGTPSMFPEYDQVNTCILQPARSPC